jgi:hypothetical protein
MKDFAESGRIQCSLDYGHTPCFYHIRKSKASFRSSRLVRRLKYHNRSQSLDANSENIERMISFGLQLDQYASIIALLLLFVDGIIFGLAIKKGVLSIILIVFGLVLASLAGLSIPFLNLTVVLNFISSVVVSEISRFGPLFLTFPVLWILGLLVGVWKG